MPSALYKARSRAASTCFQRISQKRRHKECVFRRQGPEHLLRLAFQISLRERSVKSRARPRSIAVLSLTQLLVKSQTCIMHAPIKQLECWIFQWACRAGAPHIEAPAAMLLPAPGRRPAQACSQDCHAVHRQAHVQPALIENLQWMGPDTLACQSVALAAIEALWCVFLPGGECGKGAMESPAETGQQL